MAGVGEAEGALFWVFFESLRLPRRNLDAMLGSFGTGSALSVEEDATSSLESTSW